MALITLINESEARLCTTDPVLPENSNEIVFMRHRDSSSGACHRVGNDCNNWTAWALMIGRRKSPLKSKKQGVTRCEIVSSLPPPRHEISACFNRFYRYCQPRPLLVNNAPEHPASKPTNEKPMATITNYPQQLIDEHMAWHMNPIGTPGARSATHQGIDFLNFHRNFLKKFFLWFNAQPTAFRNQFDVTPSWQSVPAELKNDARTGWNPVLAGQEQRIVTITPPFASEDVFGTFIETGIHNRYLHGACAIHFNDPNIGNPMTAPVISTYFYKIHGLVNFWGDNWRNKNTGLAVLPTPRPQGSHKTPAHKPRHPAPKKVKGKKPAPTTGTPNK